MWRVKVLSTAEWLALQNAFEALKLAAGDNPSLAMFMDGRASDPEAAIYITGPGIAAIEARSPGGWQDAKTPSGPGVKLLVGDAASWDHLGVKKPR
jgi:hypothetical protein